LILCVPPLIKFHKPVMPLVKGTFVLNVQCSVSHERKKLNQDFKELALAEFTEITKIIDFYLIF
jgi:hypothetical protein